MKKKITLLAAVLFLFLSLNGCIYVVVGSIGALGGYVVSPDTVEGVTSQSQAAVWDETIDVLSVMGTILEQQEDAGLIVAKVNGSKVTINIIAMTQSAVKLSVRARKFNLPRVSLAQDIFVKIMSKVTE